MIADPSIEFTADLPRSPLNSGIPVPAHPCDACKQSKLKCDQRRPTCETCRKRVKICNYSMADGYTDGRVRRFHRRSRNGCSHCKTRRVRCDEQKPICGGCKRKGDEHLCVYPVDNGRSSRSRSPTSQPQSKAPSRNVDNATTNFANMPLVDSMPAATNMDYFSHPIPPNNQPIFADATANLNTSLNANPVNNALSIWNPNVASPSPSSLFTSLFGPQAMDMFQQNPTPNYNESLNYPSQLSAPTTSTQPDVSYSSSVPVSDQRYAQGFNWGMNELSVHLNRFENETFTMENPDSTGSGSGSTPISLNSNTAFNSAFALVQQEYRDRPEHPAYLYQLQLLAQPDQLAPFFPSLEQRHQFSHFFHQTSHSLLTVPTAPASNPFLCHFSHLALGAPAGQSITHDTFRLALLSLASLDVGIKLDQAGPSMSDNALYATSDEQRAESYKRLKACSISGILKDDPNDADLGIATVVALSIRDRLAGCQDWEPPLTIGQAIIQDAGGPGAYINARPTADRRFLVEQLAVLELIGYLTIWISPKIFTWDNEWFRYHEAGEGTDHVQDVYGWTRDAVVYSARTMMLCGEARDVDAMREAQPKPIYRQLKNIIDTRLNSLVKRVKEFIPQGDLIRQNVMLSPLQREVTVGTLGIVGCMDLCLRTVILMDDIKSPEVQTVVATILDISEESVSRGHYAGLLLPLSWADGIAQTPSLKSRAKLALNSLKGRYHLNQALLDRICNIDWASLNTIALHDWEAFLRKNGYYVPCF